MTYKARWPREASEPVVDPLLGRATAHRKESSQTSDSTGSTARTSRRPDSITAVSDRKTAIRPGTPYPNVLPNRSIVLVSSGSGRLKTTPAEQIAINCRRDQAQRRLAHAGWFAGSEGDRTRRRQYVVIWTDATDLTDLLIRQPRKLQTRDAPLQDLSGR